MQRRIEYLEREVAHLRKILEKPSDRNSYSSSTPSHTSKSTGRGPLTELSLDEKKLLIEQIQVLPPERMDFVIETIQAAMKPNQRGDGNEDIEIPLDELDTATLRKLQRYIEVCY